MSAVDVWECMALIYADSECYRLAIDVLTSAERKFFVIAQEAASCITKLIKQTLVIQFGY